MHNIHFLSEFIYRIKWFYGLQNDIEPNINSVDGTFNTSHMVLGFKTPFNAMRDHEPTCGKIKDLEPLLYNEYHYDRLEMLFI